MGRFKSKSIETLCVQAGYEAKNGCYLTCKVIKKGFA